MDLRCLTATMSGTASTKLSRGNRENQHEKNVSTTENYRGGLLLRSILMLEQEEKPKSGVIVLTLLPAAMSPACPTWAFTDNNCCGAARLTLPSLCTSMDMEMAWDMGQASLRAAVFPDISEKGERWIIATWCEIPCFCFGKGSAAGIWGARANKWGDFYALDSERCNLPT